MLCCVTYKATIYKHIRGVNRYVKHIMLCDMYVKRLYVKLIMQYVRIIQIL